MRMLLIASRSSCCKSRVAVSSFSTFAVSSTFSSSIATAPSSTRTSRLQQQQQQQHHQAWSSISSNLSGSSFFFLHDDDGLQQRRQCIMTPTNGFATTTTTTRRRCFTSATSAKQQSHQQQQPKEASSGGGKKNKKADKNQKQQQQQEDDSGGGYLAQKRAAKDRRRVLYEARQERLVRIQTRREGKPPRDQKRKAFWSWFVRKKVHEEYMVRKAKQAGLGWHLRVAVVVERIPVILPDQADWETEYQELRTHLNQYGKAYPKALTGQDPAAPPKAMTDQDLLDLLEQATGFVPASRVTEADTAGNVRTTQRKLQDNLYLTVLQQPSSQGGDDDGSSTPIWQFPTVDLKRKQTDKMADSASTTNGDDNDMTDEYEETLLEAAKRAMETQVGPSVEFWCPSNAPWAVDLVPHTNDPSSYYGTMTFFIKVQYDDGQVSNREMKVQDYAWLNRNEAVERLMGNATTETTTTTTSSSLGDTRNLGVHVVTQFYRNMLA